MFCVQGSVKLILSIHMLIEYNTYIYDSTLDIKLGPSVHYDTGKCQWCVFFGTPDKNEKKSLIRFPYVKIWSALR